MADNTIVKKFNSAGEFLEWATNAPCKWRGALASRETGYRKTDWTGTKNYEEAYTLAKYGWEEGLSKLSKQVKIAKQLIAPVSRRIRKHDVAGHYPNPARAAAGEAFSMVRAGHDFKQKPIVKMAVNFGYNAHVDTDRIMKWGAAICSYADFLEQNGYSVEISNNSQTRGDYHRQLVFEFPLKKAGQKLSMASMVFWIAHPSALRRIEFSGMERLDLEEYYGDGYGKAVDDIRRAEPDELSLFISDSSGSLERDLETIRKKHVALQSKDLADANLRGMLQQYKFG